MANALLAVAAPEPIPPQLVLCEERCLPEWLTFAVWESERHMNRPTGNSSACNCLKGATAYDHLPWGSEPGRLSPRTRVPRLHHSQLTSQEWFEHFARPAKPLVLAGILGPHAEWYVQQAATLSELEQCCSRDYSGGGGAQQCADACRPLARIVSEAWKRAGLPPVLSFPPPLPSADALLIEEHPPYVLYGHEGAAFGRPTHYDNSCHGTLSLQYRGRKRWRMWAPWELTHRQDEGHTAPYSLHEATLEEGDVLFLPPGWFHVTEVLKGGGPSLAAAHYLCTASPSSALC